MMRQSHAEFPQFRSKLAAMGARKRQSVARESLHTMERSLSQFLPSEEVQKLGSLPGTRNRLAASIVVRPFRARTKSTGFRDVELVITTTLLDSVLWPVETLVRLYERHCTLTPFPHLF